MIKNVKYGERVATVTLDGTECAVKFGSTFNVFEVKNNSSAPVLMALSEGAAVGDDGVVSIPAGGSFCYPHMRNIDTLYLTGNGEAAVVAKNTTEPSFKSAPANGQGGGGNVTVINDNLLINPNFKINQRGVTDIKGSTGATIYTVDRWYQFGSGSHTVVNADSISITGAFRQNFEIELNPNQQYTISLELADGTKGAFATVPNGIENAISGVSALKAQLNPNGLYLRAGEVKEFKWIKLECGSVATPFIPPEPATELLKCQRYYQIRSTGNIPNCDLRPNMRDGVNPTITALSDGTYSYDAEIR